MNVPSGQEPPAVQCLYVTCANSGEASAIARTLVEERLVACANILGEARSFYWWEGKVQDETEVVLVLKTGRALSDAATRRIRDLHSYSCPCVVALDIQGGNLDFLNWIVTQTA